MSTQPKSNVLVSRIYHKGDQRISLFIRELSGGDIDGSLFRFDVWKNNIEDESFREESGNLYYIRRFFYNKLFDLQDDGWKKMSRLACSVIGFMEALYKPVTAISLLVSQNL